MRIRKIQNPGVTCSYLTTHGQRHGGLSPADPRYNQSTFSLTPERSACDFPFFKLPILLPMWGGIRLTSWDLRCQWSVESIS